VTTPGSALSSVLGGTLANQTSIPLAGPAAQLGYRALRDNPGASQDRHPVGGPLDLGQTA
jgi:hypothetical protein